MENHQAVTTLRPFYMSGVSRSLRMCVALMWLIVSSSLSAQISPIVISEVFYDSPLNECSYPEDSALLEANNGEYVELYNPTDIDVDLSGWYVMDRSTSFQFPEQSIIKSKGTLIVAYRYPGSSFKLSDLFAEISDAASASIYYQSKMLLSNDGEELTLQSPNKRIIDRMSYKVNPQMRKGYRTNFWNIKAINGLNKPLDKLLSLQRVDIRSGHSSILHSPDDYTPQTPSPTTIASEITLPQLEPYLYAIDESMSLPLGEFTGTADVSPTGGAAYNIPIVVPAGTNGVQPSLSIVYNSQSGAGILGQGFDISGLSSISRVPQSLYYDSKNGTIDQTAVKFNDSDQLALDGQRLILISGLHMAEGAVYATESESYARVSIELSDRTHQFYFVVTTKDGMRYEYGEYTTYRNYLNESDPRVLAWKLDRSVDQHGNEIVYHYQSGGRYIDHIDYSQGECTIKFEYSRLSKHRQSYLDRDFLIQPNIILSSIQTYIDAGETKVRGYHFNYIDDNSIDPRLESIGETTGEAGTQSLTRIGWGEEGKVEMKEIGDIMQMFSISDIASRDNVSFHSGDLNGDGYSDIVVMVPSVDNKGYVIRYALYNHRTKSYGVYKETLSQPNIVEFAPQLHVADINNDGKCEIIFIGKGILRTYGLNGQASVMSLMPEFSKYNFETLHWRNNNYLSFITNINNDSYPDLVIIPCKGTLDKSFGNENYAFESLSRTVIVFKGGANWFTKDQMLLDEMFPSEKAQIGSFTGNGTLDILSLIDEHSKDYHTNSAEFNSQIQPFHWWRWWKQTEECDIIRSADFDGDGYTDLLGQKKAWKEDQWGWHLYINKEMVKHPTLADIPVPVHRANNQSDRERYKVYVLDYNGDGLPDVMLGDEVRDKNRNFLYTNWYFYHNTGTTLEPDPNKSGMRLHNRIAKAEGVVVDINGDGCQDLVIPSNDQMLVFSMPGASKRSLVHTIADGEGRNIKFEYDYYKVYDQSQTEKPIRNLKHPICVVSQMTDAHGELLTFDYSGGKVHESKGFLGFERVTARNVTQDKESIMESRLDLVSNTMIPQVQKERRSARVVKESTTKSRVMAIDSHRKRYQILTDTLTQVDHLLGVTHTTIYSYDGQANLVKSVSSNGVTSTVVETSYIKASYGAYSYLPVSITTTLKRSDASDITTRTTYTYNDKGQPTQRVEYEGTGMSVTWLYSYHDKTGVVIEEKIIPTGSSPHTTTYGYDALCRYREREINHRGQLSQVQYDYGSGRVMEETDIYGMTTTYGYDACGRLSRKRLPNASTTTYSITKDNSHGAYYKKQSLEESTHRIVSIYYDKLRREIYRSETGFNGYNLISAKSYDRKGRLESETAPHYQSDPAVTTTYHYDGYDRVVGVSVSDGAQTLTTTTIYSGLTTSVTSADGQVRTTQMDGSGVIISRSDPGGTIEYKYDAAGRPSQITAAGGDTYIAYDIQGNQTKLIDPNAGEVTYTYGAHGLLTSQRDANGNLTTMIYNSLGQPLTRSVTTHDGQIHKTTYSYVTSGLGVDKLQSERLQINGQVVHEMEYLYNDKRLLIEQTQTYRDTARVLTHTTTYSYDALWRPVGTVSPTGLTTENVYNDIGDIVSVRAGGHTIWRQDELSGTTDRFTLGNGAVTTRLHSSLGRLLSIQTQSGAGDALIQDLAYGYDANSLNLLSRTDKLSDRSETFSYDALHRLTESTLNGVSEYQISYADNGNIITKTDVGDYLYDAGSKPHAMRGIEGVAGYGVTDDPQALSYTYFNKVSSVEQTAQRYNIYYGLDHQRRKSEKLRVGHLYHTRYYMGSCEIDIDSLGQECISEYIYTPSGLTAIYREGQLLYVHSDHLGSIAAVSDSASRVVCTYAYTPWGGRLLLSGESVTDRGYTLHEHIDPFGLIDMSGRMYDPVLARFLSPDPYVQAPDFTQSFNRYAYCWNNPFSYTDPSGEYVLTFFLGPLGAVIDVMLWAGTINLVSNLIAGNVTNAGHGVALFGIGALGGLAGATVNPMLAGAIIGGGNSIINQGFNKGFDNINYLDAGMGVVIGAGTSFLGSQLSSVLSGPMSSLTSSIASPILKGVVEQGLTNAVVGFTLNSTFAWASGASGVEGLMQGLEGAATGLTIGAINGAISGYQVAQAKNLNPWTGEQRGEYSVYRGVDGKGDVRYVGITERDPEIRFKEHRQPIGTGKEILEYYPEKNATGLSRTGARIMEQKLINQYGMQKDGGLLLNKINSISSKYWGQYGIKPFAK